MTPAPDDHDWTRRQLAPFAAGLLDPADDDRVERHAALCDECREVLERARASGAAPSRHLPEPLIIHWGEQAPALRGLQRELARRHLVECEECRAILKHLGHAPELKHVAGLEPSREVLDLLSQNTARVVPMPQPRWRSREFWTGSAFGGLVAAAAAVLILVVNPMNRPAPGGPATGTPVAPAPVDHGTPAPAPVSPPPAPVETPSTPNLSAAIVGTPIRTAADRAPGAPADTIHAGVDLIPVEFDLPPFDPDGRVIVTVVDPSHVLLVRREDRLSSFADTPRIAVPRGEHGFVSGLYRLRIASAANPTKDFQDSWFQLSVRTR